MTRLFVPGATRDDEEPSLFCTVPVDAEGTLCGACFYEDERSKYQRHVGACARENMEHIEAQRLAAKNPIFDENTWDPEISAHMRKVGERMRKEGRLVVRPNERAGFS
jgi:hypothetical protein